MSESNSIIKESSDVDEASNDSKVTSAGLGALAETLTAVSDPYNTDTPLDTTANLDTEGVPETEQQVEMVSELISETYSEPYWVLRIGVSGEGEGVVVYFLKGMSSLLPIFVLSSHISYFSKHTLYTLAFYFPF